jgi:hypothetical protein
MDQVQIGLKLLRPALRSPDAFKELIRQRGWRMADVAVRWIVRPETLSRIAADAEREFRWDDLARALPPLTRREQAAATAARLFLFPARPRAIPMPGPQGQSASSGVAQPMAPLCWTDDETDDEEHYASSPDGFRYQDYVGLGSELAVVSEIGSFAAEGALLMVIDTRIGVGPEDDACEEYLCESAQGDTLWLAPDQMDDWVVSTGKTRQSL